MYCTYGHEESNFNQNSLFSRSNRPTNTKISRIYQNSLKSSVRYQNGIKVFIEFSGKLIIQIFKIDVETPNFK